MKVYPEYLKRSLTLLAAAAMVIVMSIFAAPKAMAVNDLHFSDISKDSTYYDDICWAVENGIVAGYNGKFNPNQDVTILQFYTMLSRSIPEDETDNSVLGIQKGSMTYHLRRSVREGWTLGWGNDLEIYANDKMGIGAAWNAALTANGVQIYSGLLNGDTTDNPGRDGISAAKELGLLDKERSSTDSFTRAEAVSILRAANQNTKELPEPAIVNKLKGVVYNVPQTSFNSFYESMMRIPAPILNAFIADGWKVKFDIEAINAYSEQSGIWSITGMTSYDEKTIYLASEKSLLHEMGHYYQEKIHSSGMDTDVYTTFENIYAKEKWSGPLFYTGKQDDGAEFFADAFAYDVSYGAVRADPAGKDKESGLESQRYFDSLAEHGWIWTAANN